ncbi:MAG: ABC transporter permease [Conexivisphaerales archaeon]|jgi:ABC-2 type transport system permease protein
MSVRDTLVLTNRSLTKWVRNPAAIMPALFMSVFWLALFGSSFNPTNLVSSSIGSQLPPNVVSQINSQIQAQMFGGASTYITYLVAGVIALVVVINLGFGGIDIVLDRQLGFLNTLLVAPVSRTSIFFSGVWQNFTKAMVLALATFIIGLILPDGLKLASGFGPLSFVEVFVAVALLTFGFCSAFTAVAFSVKSIDSLVGIVNFLVFPLVFASSAIFPSSSFPDWLKWIAEVNPVSKAAEAVRLLIIDGSLSSSELSTLEGDLVYLLAFAVILTLLGVYVGRRALAPK